MKRRPETVERTALLVALASILQILESYFPCPVPGVRLGMANMVTLIALVNLGPRCAMEVAVLRTIVGSLLLGTFLSPSFLMSLAAAAGSTLVMSVAFKLLMLTRSRYNSLISVSLVGAFSHNAVQLSMAYLVILRHKSVLLLAPWLGLSAVVTGWLTGLVALYVCRRLEDGAGVPAGGAGQGGGSAADILRSPAGLPVYVDTPSPLHRLPPLAKLLAVILLTVVALIMNSVVWLACSLVCTIVLGLVARIPLTALLRLVRRQVLLVLFAFLMPVLFTQAGRVLYAAGPLTVTLEGVMLGASFALRLVLLMVGAALLLATTRPLALTGAFRQLLAPLKFTGFDSDRFAAVLSLSWISVPAIWAQSSAMLAGRRRDGAGVRTILSDLAGIVAELYRQAGAREGAAVTAEAESEQ